MICPCCNYEGEFKPFGLIARENAKCPKCGSLERHRLYYLFLKDNLPIDKQLFALHIAPEKSIEALLRSYKNISYLSCGLSSGMIRQDITNTSFPDNTFDFIFCSHVLEHIPEDRKAMSELFRILKPKGKALLQAPIDFNRSKTYEDFTITDPKERELHFQQWDHVRIYGRDYIDRLTESGFKITTCQYNTDKKFNASKELLFICEK